MAITTLDAALAGMQPPRLIFKSTSPNFVVGVPMSFWYCAGIPCSGSAAPTTAGGVVLSTSSAQVNGAIYHTDPAANSYLARLVAKVSEPGQLLLCDRLLHCGGTTAGAAISATVTTAQTVNTIALPARDANGATLGVGVNVAVECAATMGAGSGTASINYTNSAGTTGRVSQNVVGWQSASAQGQFYWMALSQGDQGVRSVQTLTLSASLTSGTLNLVFFRIIAALDLTVAYQPNSLDALTGGFPQLFNGSTMFFVFVPQVAGPGLIIGALTETQG